MSTEDDTELRDLVAQTLEANGCLARIRAQLRASIFMALDEDEKKSLKKPLLNNKVKCQLETREGCLMFSIVREFLSFYDLDYTLSVYDSESYLGTYYTSGDRSKMLQDLGLSQLKDESAFPVLWQIINLARNGTKSHNQVHRDTRKLQTHEQCKSLDESNKLENDDNFVTATEDNESDLTENLENTNQINVGLRELNETFDLSIPTLNLNVTDEDSSSNQSDVETSPSAGRDTEIPLNGATEHTGETVEDNDDEKASSPTDSEFSPPVVKESKSKNVQKVEKLKSNLSSMVDMPPLQLSKSNAVLLPPLYSKEFKEKSNLNLKEVDKFLDVDLSLLDNYEEDFISESELNFTKRSASAELKGITDESTEVEETSQLPTPNGNLDSVESVESNCPLNPAESDSENKMTDSEPGIADLFDEGLTNRSSD